MTPIEQRFLPFNLFLFFWMRLASLRLANLIITFLGPLLFNQWQSSMFEGLIATSNLSKILMIVSSRSSLLILSEMPVISKHSRLEYWLFPQHCLSNATTRSCNLLFTFFETDNSDSIFSKSLRSWIKCYQILLDIPKSTLESKVTLSTKVTLPALSGISGNSEQKTIL